MGASRTSYAPRAPPVCREAVQQWLEAANPAYGRRCAAAAPDGDADIDPGDRMNSKLPTVPAVAGY
ncbi:MAG TPA: hypothetical protein VN325_45385 [Steroidobacteraceae bacterium]|nr:hypothetical protein [Steroidobacteraceae bacterium]